MEYTNNIITRSATTHRTELGTCLSEAWWLLDKCLNENDLISFSMQMPKYRPGPSTDTDVRIARKNRR